VLVPGALVALARPRGRTEAAFAACAVVFAAGLLLEAALVASNISGNFQERYLFALLPLVPLAFGLYMKHGRPAQVPVALVAAGLLLVSERIPISGYSAGLGKTDSPFLFAVARLEQIVGTGNASLAVALLAALGAAGAVAVSRRGGARIAVGATIFVAAVASLGAIVTDSATARQVRGDYPPGVASWVDALGLPDVTLVQTVGSPPARAVEQLYWNRSISHEALLGAALPTDVYPAARIRIARDGTLSGVGRHLLVQGFGATVRFANATLIARAGTFSVWSAEESPRLALLEQPRYSDGWLASNGRLTVWPDATGRTRGMLGFSLTLPQGAQPVTVRFGRARYRVEPGRVTALSYTIDTRGLFSLAFSSVGGRLLPDLRAVSVLSTPPHFVRAAGATAATKSSA
jgi:hypothetical protein